MILDGKQDVLVLITHNETALIFPIVLQVIPDGDRTWLSFRRALRQRHERQQHHNDVSVPGVVVGGRDHQMKGNRHLRYPKGTRLANLSMSLMDEFGVNVERSGDSTGELDLLSGV